MTPRPSTLVLSGFSVWIGILTWAQLCRWANADPAFLPGLGLVALAMGIHIAFTSLIK